MYYIIRLVSKGNRRKEEFRSIIAALIFNYTRRRWLAPYKLWNTVNYCVMTRVGVGTFRRDK